MSAAVLQLLNVIKQLPIAEQLELHHAMAETVPMSDDLTDDDFAALAAASFRALDEEEAHAA
ncbi:hypothetical protein [Prosthecobacter sp.]|uniref:hypothetical protein n=1 Tax=Prosthecobacter sp. TaxID=1965333 RepID=UPI0037844CDD